MGKKSPTALAPPRPSGGLVASAALNALLAVVLACALLDEGIRGRISSVASSYTRADDQISANPLPAPVSSSPVAARVGGALLAERPCTTKIASSLLEFHHMHVTVSELPSVRVSATLTAATMAAVQAATVGYLASVGESVSAQSVRVSVLSTGDRCLPHGHRLASVDDEQLPGMVESLALFALLVPEGSGDVVLEVDDARGGRVNIPPFGAPVVLPLAAAEILIAPRWASVRVGAPPDGRFDRPPAGGLPELPERACPKGLVLAINVSQPAKRERDAAGDIDSLGSPLRIVELGTAADGCRTTLFPRLGANVRPTLLTGRELRGADGLTTAQALAARMRGAPAGAGTLRVHELDLFGSSVLRLTAGELLRALEPARNPTGLTLDEMNQALVGLAHQGAALPQFRTRTTRANRTRAGSLRYRSELSCLGKRPLPH